MVKEGYLSMRRARLPVKSKHTMNKQSMQKYLAPILAVNHYTSYMQQARNLQERSRK